MFVITKRDEDGTWYWLGGNFWASTRTWVWGPEVRYFYHEAYAQKLAEILDATIPGKGYERGPVRVRRIP